MSGIAGILRRDGRPVSENWVNYLEQSLMLNGTIPHRFEDSVAIQSGDLHVILMGSDMWSNPGADHTVIDGEIEGECAFAKWKIETLELELSRKGTGQIPLYWLDFAEAGDGYVFCSNPLPLLRIARELELPLDFLSEGLHEYFKYGYVPEGGALLLPVCTLPLQFSEGKQIHSICDIPCSISTTTAEDVRLLVKIFGMPFADHALLSTLWQYREAKRRGHPVIDGVGVSNIKEHASDRALSKRIALHAIANHVGVDVSIRNEHVQITPIPFPLAAWFRSPQSDLGQLLGDTIHASDAFEGLSVRQKDVVLLHDAHIQGQDHTKQLFALLTLALWRQQVHA